jgi:hypothetical protein
MICRLAANFARNLQIFRLDERCCFRDRANYWVAVHCSPRVGFGRSRASQNGIKDPTGRAHPIEEVSQFSKYLPTPAPDYCR